MLEIFKRVSGLAVCSFVFAVLSIVVLIVRIILIERTVGIDLSKLDTALFALICILLGVATVLSILTFISVGFKYTEAKKLERNTEIILSRLALLIVFVEICYLFFSAFRECP